MTELQGAEPQGISTEVALAIARRNAVLAAARAHGPATVRELVMLETGAFDSRAARDPGPSPGAVAAYALLDADCLSESDLEAARGSFALLVEHLVALHGVDSARIETLGKAAPSSWRVHRALERWPIASMDRIIETTGLKAQAVTSSMHRLRALGIVREVTRRHRHRLYCYDGWLALLDADVERALNEPEDEP